MDVDTLPVLWRRPGCCSPCFQPPCCGLRSRHGWSTEAPPPSLGSAQELAFLLFGHTHMIIATIPPGKNSPVLTGVYKCAAFFEETAPEWVVSSEYRRSRAAITSKTQTHAPTCSMAKEKKPISISRLWQCEWRPYGVRWWRWFLWGMQSDTKLQSWKVNASAQLGNTEGLSSEQAWTLRD